MGINEWICFHDISIYGLLSGNEKKADDNWSAILNGEKKNEKFN